MCSGVRCVLWACIPGDWRVYPSCPQCEPDVLIHMTCLIAKQTVGSRGRAAITAHCHSFPDPTAPQTPSVEVLYTSSSVSHAGLTGTVSWLCVSVFRGRGIRWYQATWQAAPGMPCWREQWGGARPHPENLLLQNPMMRFSVEPFQIPNTYQEIQPFMFLFGTFCLKSVGLSFKFQIHHPAQRPYFREMVFVFTELHKSPARQYIFLYRGVVT